MADCVADVFICPICGACEGVNIGETDLVANACSEGSVANMLKDLGPLLWLGACIVAGVLSGIF